MSALSDHLEESILEHIFKDVTYAKPATIYVGLFTSAPGEVDAPASECDYTGYARVDAAAGAAIGTGWSSVSNNDTGTGKKITNAKEITFGANQDETAQTVTHVGIFDTLTSGHMLFWSPLSSSKTLNQGDVLSFSIGSIKVVLD